MVTYIKDGQLSDGKVLYLGDRTILSPTEEQLLEAGWKKINPPTPTAEELVQRDHEARISELKDYLAQGDYKVIKCAEAQLANEAMPYDVTKLIAERNEYRAEINKLESQTTLNDK